MNYLRILRPPAAPGWWDPVAKGIEEAFRRLAGRTGSTRSFAANVSLTASDGSAFVDASGAPRTITLPPASSVTGRIYTVKKVDASANAVTIDPTGTETIDGASTATISGQYDSLTMQSDGTRWWII